MYNIAQNNDNGGTRITGQPTFNSIQPRTRFQLHSSTPGRMYYEVKQIGDASYPLEDNKDTIIPRSERLLFEQQVSIRPSARFRNRNRMTYCLNDVLVPLDPSSQDGYLVLEGTPPFSVVLSIKNIGASHVDKRTIQVPTNTWRLDLPTYSFSSIGPHLVSIETVMDSSSCEQAALDPLLKSIWVDVAETAAIIPFERREDICVGDITQFQLEGIPPWTIGYVQPRPTSLTLTDSDSLADIKSTASPTPRKPKPRHFRSLNSNLACSPSRASHISKRCARLLLPISGSKSMLCRPPKLDMERRSSRIFTKVGALNTAMDIH